MNNYDVSLGSLDCAESASDFMSCVQINVKALGFHESLSSEWTLDKLNFVGLVFLVFPVCFAYYCSKRVRRELEPAVELRAMDPNNDIDEVERRLAAAMRLREDLISSGCSVECALWAARTVLSLHTGISDLTRFEGASTETESISVPISASALSEQFAPADKALLALLPWWKELCSALTSVTPSDWGCIKLSLRNVRLGKELMEVLLDAFQKAPLEALILDNNGLGIGGGMDLMIRALKKNTAISVLSIENDPIESDHLLSLVDTVTNHPSIEAFGLVHCDIGRNNTVMEAIVPDLLGGLEEVHLHRNSIGSFGAKLISTCLARNPPGLRMLDLQGNGLDDDDARGIAASLKMNNSLQVLRLRGNNITQDGDGALLRAILGRTTLGDIHDANHTCWIGSGELLTSRNFNKYVEPEANRKIKLLSVLYPNEQNYHGMSRLDDVPVKLMPRVLFFLRDGVVERRQLYTMFHYMRQWNMPLLYTNSDPNLRRSDRIRKKLTCC